MSLFDSSFADFSSLTKEINNNVAALKMSSRDTDKSSTIIAQTDSMFNQANDLIRQMEVEARSNDSATRKQLTEKVSVLKRSLLATKTDFKRAKEDAESHSLIGSRSQNDRQRFNDTNEKLIRQNDMIANAHRTVEETEEIGLEITAELQRNREKIESSRAKTYDFSIVTDQARNILNSMGAREVRTKYMIAFIAVVLIIAFSLAIYFGTGGKTKK